MEIWYETGALLKNQSNSPKVSRGAQTELSGSREVKGLDPEVARIPPVSGGGRRRHGRKTGHEYFHVVFSVATGIHQHGMETH